jgi:HK97 family phage major capsid protein
MTTDVELIASQLAEQIDEKVASRFTDLETQIAEQVERRFAESTESDPPPPDDGPNPAEEWKSFGEWLRAVKSLDRGFEDARLKVLTEGDADAGGALVPDEFRNTLLSLALQSAVVRPRATVIPMAGQSMRIPAIRDTTHASNVFGGVTGYWTEESGSITASEPTFSSVGFTAKKLSFYTSASNELLADSALALESLLMTLFSEGLAWFEDSAFTNGSGTGEPLGFRNASALISVAAETGQDASTIVTENLDKMYARQLNPGRAVWVVNRTCMPQLFALSRSVGTGGGPVYVTNVAGSPPMSIYGQPVVQSEHMAALGTTGDIAFVDFGHYVIADRQDLSIASSPHVRFQNDENVWRGTQRLDGRPWLDSALTPNAGDTLSPIVTLATRS